MTVPLIKLKAAESWTNPAPTLRNAWFLPQLQAEMRGIYLSVRLHTRNIGAPTHSRAIFRATVVSRQTRCKCAVKNPSPPSIGVRRRVNAHAQLELRRKNAAI